MAAARIVMPATAKKGDLLEIKTLVQHQMETGYRRDNVGKTIPRDIIKVFAVSYNGAEVFRAELSQGVAANPYFYFSTRAVESGELVFEWTDESGRKITERRQIVVS